MEEIPLTVWIPAHLAKGLHVAAKGLDIDESEALRQAAQAGAVEGVRRKMRELQAVPKEERISRFE